MPDGAETRTKAWSRGSKGRIVDAATALFAAHGYSGTTIEQIGAAAGLTGPAIYRHYRSKAALFEEVMYLARLPAWEHSLALREAGGEPADVLRRIVAAWVEQSVHRRELMRVYAQQHRDLDEAMRRRVRVQYRQLTDVWVELLARIHPDRSVAELTTMVDSAMWLLRSPAFYRSTLSPAGVCELLTTMMWGALSIGRADGDRAVTAGTASPAVRAGGRGSPARRGRTRRAAPGSAPGR